MKRVVLLFVPCLPLIVASSCSQGEQQVTSAPAAGGQAPAGGTCPAGQTLCGTECVALATNTSHCGACNKPCGAGQACVDSACTCPSGSQLCGTACAYTQSDASNCGTCGKVCSVGASCQAGVCTCQNGQTECSGSCVDLQSDGSNCGKCGNPCAAGQVCSAGVCGTECGNGLTPCGSSCVDLQTSQAHCGKCDNACAPGQACSAGQCGCGAGSTLCEGACVDTQTNASHCGACGVACTGGKSCQSGSCACPSGQEYCGSQCTDTATDASNCGTCGKACGAGQSCVSGSCVGGSTNTGGGGGTGGATAGGGSSTGGATGGGGSSTGGATGDGGSSTGGTSTGGAEGIDPAVFAPDIDGFLWEGTCSSAASGDDRQCSILNDNGSCNDDVTRDITKSVHGDAGKAYVMEIEVRGLLGSRCYTGGTRRAGNTPVNWTGPNDGLYIGGTVPQNWWNTYEVHVQNAAPGAESTFYLNCYYDNPTPTIEFDREKCTMEEVIEVGYTFELEVMGNATITFRLNDQNCKAQMNCGAYQGVTDCPSPRTVDLSGMDPPADFEQPRINAIGGATLYPQWAYFDVKSVTEK